MSKDAPVHLPDDLSVCHEIIRQQQLTLNSSNRRIEQLEHRLDLLLRAKYGPHNEKLDEAQLRLFAAELLELQGQTDTDQAAEEEEPQRHRNKNRGRRPLPKDLPRRRIEHPVPAEELCCPDCGKTRERFSEEVSEQLDYVPASLFVVEHVRPKYVCKSCAAHVVIADKPTQPIEKGLAGPGLLAQVIVSKYGDHLPLYRLERIFKRHGLKISRSTTCGWMAQCAELLKPLYSLMTEQIRHSKVIHTDDTVLPVQDRQRDRTRQGRVWVYVGDRNHPYTVFDYTPNRSRDGPIKWLDSFSGYLQADAYSGYDVIYQSGTSAGPVVEVACWAHTRRKFFESRLTAPGPAHTAMAWIQKLYAIETQIKDLDATERCQVRKEQALPLLQSLRVWLIEQQSQNLPKSPVGQAISYTMGNWEALVRYTTDGDLAIDNNVAERAIKPLVIGRKNYLFAGSDNGGRTAAVLYSLVCSCQQNDIDPFVYLRDVISRISDHPMKQLDQLLPDRWKVAGMQSTESVCDMSN